jgi:phage-related protein
MSSINSEINSHESLQALSGNETPKPFPRAERLATRPSKRPSRPISALGGEIRIWDEAGTSRVIYTARIGDTVVVLHAFQTKTQTTSKRDIELARARSSQLKK